MEATIAAPAEAAAPSTTERRRTVIALVGCGFLGSLFAEELAKRLFAHEEILHIICIDDDRIDERNPANHLYTCDMIGALKANVLQSIVGNSNYHGVTAENIPRRVGKGDEKMLEEADIIVDAVDNLETRQWLWGLGVRGTPVLHLGVSQDGTGCVEWTIGEYDTFSLSPTQLMAYTKEQLAGLTKLVKLPPCDLVGFRGLGLLTALAGAKAVCLAYGMDPENTLDSPGKRAFTSWTVTNMGHQLREKQDVI